MEAYGAKLKEEIAWHEETYNGRWPYNIKSGISQQPQIETFENFQLKFKGLNKTFCQKPQIEDKINH